MSERDEAAEDLLEAWAEMREAWRKAMRLLRDDDEFLAFDAYLGRVFDTNDALLGQQSVDQWVRDAAEALRTGDYGRCARCGERFTATSERAEVVSATSAEVIHVACMTSEDVTA